jgi:putative sterol carrier protein
MYGIVLTPPFTQPWADDLRHAINSDLGYREAGKTWSWPLAFVLDDGAPVGLIGPVALVLALENGVCRSARIISPDACTAPFIFRAPYAEWRRIMQDEQDAVHAVVQGRVSLSGNMNAIITHARSIAALLRCARSVPTDYPSDPVVA